MEIPFDIFIYVMAFIGMLPLMGYAFRFTMPISLFFFLSAVFMISVLLAIDTIIMGQLESETLNFNIQEIYHQHTSDFEFAVRSGGVIAIGQEVGPTSDLISESFFDRLDCIQLPLSKTGNPTGNVTIAVFDQSVNIIYPFATIDITTIPTSPTFDWYDFCLPLPEHHFIEEGDVIGLSYTGGNTTNFLRVKTTNTDVIAGSVVNTATGSIWADVPTRDMTMVLYNRAETTELTYISDEFDFTFTGPNYSLKVIMIFIAVMLMLGGALIEVKQRN